MFETLYVGANIMRYKVMGILMCALAAVLAWNVQLASADCVDTVDGIIDGSNDSISCTGTDPDGVDAGAGNDTVTVEAGATVNNNADGVDGSNGNDVLINNGTINATSLGADGLMGDEGSNTLINNGTITANRSAMEVLSDLGETNLIINNGNATSIGITIFGDSSYDSIYNYGTLTSTNSIGISAASGNDYIFNSGTVTGGNGTAIFGSFGNDTVQIVLGSTINGNLSGGPDTDLLIFQLDADQSTLDAFNNYITTSSITVASGSLTFLGKTYTWLNFEQLQFLLHVIASGGVPSGGDVPVQVSGPQAICESAIKVFRQPSGDLDVYSGFDALPPNGFLIGRITQGELAAGVRRFQDIGTAAQLDWVVEVTLSDRLIIQVFDGQGNPIGTCTP